MNIGDNRWHSKYVCDKCGDVIPYITKKGYRDNLYHHYVSTVNRVNHKDFDLCGSCEKELREWLKLKPLPDIKKTVSKFLIYEED